MKWTSSSNNSSKQRQKSYCKKTVQISTSNKIKDSFLTFATNTSYFFGGGINKISHYFSSDARKQNGYICLHGRKFEKEADAQDYMKMIIWFSYRQIPGLTKNLNSDNGWGCLIRVGQMALAAGLKRFLDLKLGEKPVNISTILPSFVENGKANEKYSLTKIVEYASQKFDLNYGSWFKTYEICEVLSRMHNKDPLKQAQNLIVIHFKNSMVYLEQVFKALDKKMCQCQKRRFLCQTCTKNQSCQSQITKPKLQHSQNMSLNSGPISKEKHALLFINCRVSAGVIDERRFNQILELLELECSLGIIGGVPRKGFYFVGFDNKELIYLDPHIVQNYVSLQNLNTMLKSFSTKQLRRAKRTEIDPSMAFVFYIDGLETLKKLYIKLEQIKERENEDPIILSEWVNRYHEGEEISEIREDQSEVGSQFDHENSFLE